MSIFAYRMTELDGAKSQLAIVVEELSQVERSKVDELQKLEVRFSVL